MVRDTKSRRGAESRAAPSEIDELSIDPMVDPALMEAGQADDIEDTHSTATRLAQLAQLSESTRYGVDATISPFNVEAVAGAVSGGSNEIVEMLGRIVQQNQQLAEAVKSSKRDHDKMERELRDEIRSLKETYKTSTPEAIEPKNKKAKVKLPVSNKCKNVVQHYFNYHLGKTYATKPKKIDYEPGMVKEWPEPTEEGHEVVLIGGVDRHVFRPPWGAIGTRVAGEFQQAVLSSARDDCGGEFTDDEFSQAFATYYGNASNAYKAEQTIEGRAAKAQRMRKNRRLQRQIAMLNRRTKAFDSSPHNKCAERDLLKAALLNIATVPELTSEDEEDRLYVHTYDDGSRAELEKEHYIREQFGAHMPGTRYVECRDIAWLDDDMRLRAYLLDEWANQKIGTGEEQSSSQRFNPSTVYHVPRARWARSTQPDIRARDDDGEPVEDKSGSVIIYKNTVAPDVTDPWTQELYDPPMPTPGSLSLRPFDDVISAPTYAPIVKAVSQRKKAMSAPVVDHMILIEEDMERNTRALAGLRT